MRRPYAEVIGDPIAHSKSPAIHGFWLEQLGIDAEYRATRVSNEALDDFLEGRRTDRNWRGCNVAMPLKQAVIDRVACDSVARRIGASNTIVCHDGVLVGRNTDWMAINALLDVDRLRPQRAAVIGSGGAARAALEELRQAQVARVDLISRSPKRAQALLEHFGLVGEVLGPGDTPAVDLLINASPLGMANQPALKLDLSGISDGGTVFDMVYVPAETPLLKRARTRGLRTIDGLSMLIHQAGLAFEHFFKARPEPIDSPQLRDRLTS